MADVNRRYFEALMESRDLSLRSLAKKMDMSHSQLSLTFSGVRKPQLEEVSKISMIFGEPVERIITNFGVNVPAFNTRTIPVVGAMIGDGSIDETPTDVIERTYAPELVPADGVAIQFRTAGSPIEWLDGAVFFCGSRDGVDPSIIGRIALAKAKDGPMFMGTVRRGYRENTHNITGPYVANSVVLEWASPVIFARL